MYAYIKGEIVDISEDNVVLECHDIGYNIKVPFSVIQQLPGIGSQVRIYTYTCVREDAFILYGFLTKDDLWIFKKLITVSNLGTTKKKQRKKPKKTKKNKKKIKQQKKNNQSP